jgi:hypothetical protein
VFKNKNIETMNQENQKPITSDKNVEEQERLKVKYEEESKAKDQKILDLQNLVTKKNTEIFELQNQNKRTTEERDDWKTEATAARKVYQENKQEKETTDVLTELAKLQEKKGIKLDINK